MPTYRVYRLDGDGRIAGADWVEAADDNDAMKEARKRSDGARFELWEGRRLVGRLPADAPVNAVRRPSRPEA